MENNAFRGMNAEESDTLIEMIVRVKDVNGPSWSREGAAFTILAIKDELENMEMYEMLQQVKNLVNSSDLPFGDELLELL